MTVEVITFEDAANYAEEERKARKRAGLPEVDGNSIGYPLTFGDLPER